MQTGSRWRLGMVAVRARRDREQAATIAKYEQGHQGVALSEPEEEDDDSGRLFPDRLGFLHEKMLLQDSVLGTKQKHMETRRLQKWVKMLKNYTKYCDSKKFHRRCFKGIPSQVRGSIWMLMLDVNTKKAQNVGKYKAMKEQSRLQSTPFDQINWPVRGSFRNHLLFQERNGARQQALLDVLMAYTVYNPEVGCGQGLSHLVALLLMWLSEEDTFWALVQLMENKKYAMSGLYARGSPKLKTLQNHLGDIVHRTLPALEQHLEQQGLNLQDCTAHWFTQCFLDVAPFPLALRMWDIFVLEGQHVLTTMAYTMLKVHRRRLLKMTRDHLQEFLQESLKQVWTPGDDIVIKQLQASKHELRKLHCLLPPQAKPNESCSLCLGLPRVSLEQMPPPKTLKPSNMTAESSCEQNREITSHPEGTAHPESSSLHMVLKSSPEEEDENSTEGNTKGRGSGSCGVTSECEGSSDISPHCGRAWKGRRLSTWASNSCLRLPAKGTGRRSECGTAFRFRRRACGREEEQQLRASGSVARAQAAREWEVDSGDLLERGLRRGE
ncbi:USP6 N-terminal-like protein [Ochotona princeps]|uniref:USP6 N-terminal-like protein n=1 Tax=Ochotona princeps TaxID=9978 RepID=UPI0027149812|nr:USP6 N-terminal-like protein [Ochotona princeps]